MKEDNEKLLVENKESNEEKNDDTEFEEIFICYKRSCCCMTIYIILSIIFPFFIYSFLIREPYKQYARVYKKKKLLIIYHKGIIPCCGRFDEKFYNFDNIRYIELRRSSQDYKKNSTEKLYSIDGTIYLVNPKEKEKDYTQLCLIKKDTIEKYNELVSFFKKYFETRDESSDYARKSDHVLDKNEISPTNEDIQDNLEIAPKTNENSQITS